LIPEAIMKHALFTLLVLAAPATTAEPVYSWRTRADEPDRVYLYRDGKQIGGWDYQAKHYRSLDGDTWGPPKSAAPVTPPARAGLVQTQVQSVMQSQIQSVVGGQAQSKSQTKVQSAVQWSTPPAIQPLVIRRGFPIRGKITEAIMESMTKQMGTMIGEAMAKMMTQAVGDMTIEMLSQLPGVRMKK
jgi:hypothetical protein